QPRFWPARHRQCRRRCRIEQRRFEMTREDEPRIDIERVIVFEVIAFKAVLAIDALLGADKAKLWIAQRDAIIGVPSAQPRARHFARHAADRGALPAPARRWIADPGLAAGLIHVLVRHPAEPTGAIMILPRRHRRPT